MFDSCITPELNDVFRVTEGADEKEEIPAFWWSLCIYVFSTDRAYIQNVFISSFRL